MRPTEEALSAVLRKKGFRFMNRQGEVTLQEIYQAVQERFPMLCEDEYACPHFENRTHLPEWKHTVRGVLDSFKNKGKVEKMQERDEIWIFL